MVKIFIDPGHGGSDSGATANGIQEKDITLKIGMKIRNILTAEYSNVSILMSRTGDTFPSLSDRTNAANGWSADYFLSVHINSGGGTGFESYVYPGVGAPSTTYQNYIHSEVQKLNQLTDRGKKQSDFHVLRESNMPAILTENGFIDTANDAAKMKSDAWITNIARGHVNGLVKCFNLPNKDSATFHTVVSGDTVYSLGIKYGSTADQIKEWNSLDSNYTINVGQVLRVK
ncbi:N-acetylmuramoyl-L-alanine amidase [Viridibacillus sp. YIM B01967]|uniref:N-acetylmuramoyl-L-alanine amidase n=1 Tax=Viridibacillus soli TaxID=2798301 RepID=A0ABS1H235_9BACL|nr:N-acetylmuramoyl-L-alanine amidase [Viridibacillus soli]MBK3493475.1 N-acetylmuramoyl-L-alanine amidase [Viridibacillus soli]